MFNTYGRAPSKKLTTFPGEDTVEENIHITDITTKREQDNESIQSVRLEFAEPREDSPYFDVEGAGGEEGEGSVNAVGGEADDGSGVEIKINLSAFDEMEKDTAL